MGADDPQPRLAQLSGARRPDEEGDVAPGLSEAPAEISTGRTGSHDQ
jgi:hypothetical protein